jgi:hypothetical protein
LAPASVANLYWRPGLHPQMLLNGLWLPLAGQIFPEAVAAMGQAPWTGQRAGTYDLWHQALPLPAGFEVEMALNIGWPLAGHRVLSVPGADWTNPIRPKPHLREAELDVLLTLGHQHGRLKAPPSRYRQWWKAVAELLDSWNESQSPEVFDRQLLAFALATLPDRDR